MAKKVKVLCEPTMSFSIGEDLVRADALTVEQAELVAAQYPGRYVEVVDRPAEAEKSGVSPAKSVEPTK